MKHSFRRLSLVSAVLLASALAACDTKIEHPGQPTKQPPQQSNTVVEGGGSSLGKAKGSAEKVADKVDAHNREIEKAADDASNGK